mgnify:CR=1 FL=1
MLELMQMMIVNMPLVFLDGTAKSNNSRHSVKIGEVQITMILDSGASCNVLDRKS